MPSDEAPRRAADSSPEQRILLWVDLMDTCDEFVKAGLRHRIGPDGDLRAAYAAWYREQRAEHEQTIRRMLARLDQRR